MSVVTVLSSETLAEILEELEAELLLTEQQLNKAVSKMGDRVTDLSLKYLKLRKRLLSMNHGFVVLSQNEDHVQLDLPGITSGDCVHPKFLPDDEGVVRCVVCQSAALGVTKPARRPKSVDQASARPGRPHRTEAQPIDFAHAPGCTKTPPEGTGACCLLEQVRIDAERAADAYEAEQKAEETAPRPREASPTSAAPMRRRNRRQVNEPTTAAAPF